MQAGTAREILVNALQLERLVGGRLPDHSGDDLLISVAIQHLHAGHFLILVRAAGERGSVQSGGVRISVESAPIKCHIRAGCPHPAAQGRRIPTPVCTPRALASRRALARNDTGGAMWASSPYDAGRRGRRPLRDGRGRAYRADRVVRPYKAEQEPCKYGKAPLQLCRRGASSYTQSSMLLRSTATSKGAAVASLI